MAGTIKRLSVVLDHKLLAEARRLTRSRTKRATIGIFETTEAEFRSRRRRAHARS